MHTNYIKFTQEIIHQYGATHLTIITNNPPLDFIKTILLHEHIYVTIKSDWACHSQYLRELVNLTKKFSSSKNLFWKRINIGRTKHKNIFIATSKNNNKALVAYENNQGTLLQKNTYSSLDREIIIHYISPDKHLDVVGYATSTNHPQLVLTDIYLDTLELPALEESNFSYINNLSTSQWIKNGVLCQPFLYNSGFGSLRVSLKSTISSTSKIIKLFASEGMGNDRTHNIYFKYAAEKNKLIDNTHQRDWRSRFFVSTSLGYWTSEYFFKRYGHTFEKSGFSQREQIIRNIQNATDEDISNWISTFIKKLENIFQKMEHGNFYLHTTGTGLHPTLDCDKYASMLKAQIDADIRMSHSPSFIKSYISGYSFTRFPSILENELGWDDFLESTMVSLESENQKLPIKNEVLKTIKHNMKLQNFEIFEDFLRSGYIENQK